jgi:hypothetical protein
VAPDLAEHRGDSERGERGRAVDVEAVDRLQQADGGDLHEIVERLSAALVAACELARQRQEPLDERRTRREISITVVPRQQAAVSAEARRTVVAHANGGLSTQNAIHAKQAASGAEETPRPVCVDWR